MQSFLAPTLLLLIINTLGASSSFIANFAGEVGHVLSQALDIGPFEAHYFPPVIQGLDYSQQRQSLASAETRLSFYTAEYPQNMFHTIGSIIGHCSYLYNNSFTNTEMAFLIFEVECESIYWLDLLAEVREHYLEINQTCTFWERTSTLQ